MSVPIVKAIRLGHSIFKLEMDCQPKTDSCFKMKIRKIMNKMQMSKYKLRFFNKLKKTRIKMKKLNNDLNIIKNNN